MLLQLFRQILEYVPFQPAQDKRPGHFLQAGHRRLVAALHDRAFNLPLKYVIAVQKARHQIVKNTPQLTQPVLNGGTGEGVPGLALDHLHGLCRRCGMVLDVLRLVDDLVLELLVLVKQDIPFQQVVRRDKHIRFLIRINDTLPFLLGSCDQ